MLMLEKIRILLSRQRRRKYLLRCSFMYCEIEELVMVMIMIMIDFDDVDW